MAKRRSSRLLRAVTQTNLADMGQYASKLVYSIGKRGISEQFIRQIMQKAYDEIGSTEITAATNSQWSEQPKQNLDILAALYENHPWVYICSSWIADALGGIPLRVHTATGYEDGKETLEAADETAVGKMFRWMNPQQSPVEFNRDLVTWLLLTGEAYVVHTQPGPGTPSGIPHELYVLFSPNVEKVVSPVHGIIAYNYNVTGEIVQFDASEVTYFKTFSPAGRYRGQGLPMAGRVTIATDQELRRFNRNVLNNGVHISGVLETEEDMGKEEANVVRDSFNSQYGGASKAAKLAVLWGGLKFSPQTILQKDIMMTEQITTGRDEVIALFGLKPELLTEKFANKATAETVRRMAYEDTVLGRWGRLIASVWNSTGLMKYGEELRVKWDVSEVPALQTSIGERVISGEVATRSGQMNLNEARDKFLGLPPIDGVEGDVYMVNGIPVAHAIEGDTGSDPEEPPKHTNLAKVMNFKGSQYGTEAKASPDALAWARMQRTAEARLETALRKTYREIGKNVRASATRSEVHSKILADIEQAFFFDGRTAVVKNMSAAVRQSIDDAVELEMARLAKVGVEGVFDVKPVRALARLNAQEQRLRLKVGQQWTELQKTMGEGLSNGESTAKLGQRVSAFFDGKRGNFATIARTETTAAINGATMDVAIAARDKGVNLVSVWLTNEDERVRRPPEGTKNHVQAHGLTIIPGEELFKVSGQNLEYPGDSWNGATADNTINCRCRVQNEVRELSADDNRGES